MSWLFSQALVAAYSGAISSDGEPSAPSSGNPTQLAYLPPDRMMAFSRPSRFGMTFRHLTDDLGQAVLTSYLAAFPARTSLSPEKAQESTEPAAVCGPTWRASLARFDPATSSWRTAQPSLLEDLGESSVTWPRSGMTAGGQCWELPMSGRRISGIGSGLSVPTPTVYDSTGKGTPRKDSNLDQGGRHGVSLHHFVAKWPTPTVCGNYNRAGASAKAGDGLATAVAKWPTPIASDSRGSSGRPAPGKQTQLVDAVRFATPLSRDYKSGKFSEDGKAHRESQTRGKPLSEQIGGKLNPTWVEWLMGWPLGWTDLKPLEMDKSHCVQQ